MFGILYVYPAAIQIGVPLSHKELCPAAPLAGLISEASLWAWYMLHLLEGSDGWKGPIDYY